MPTPRNYLKIPLGEVQTPTCRGQVLHTKSARNLKMLITGCAEGQSPFAGGSGVSPDFLFITPFLARKGAGGMVESDARHAAWVLKSWGFSAKPTRGAG